MGHCPNAGLPPPTFRATLARLLDNWWQREYVLPLVHRLDRCGPEDVTAIEHMRAFTERAGTSFDGAGVPSAAEYVPNLSFGLQAHVALSELWPSDPPTVEALADKTRTALAMPGASLLLASQYEGWPRYPRDERHGQWPDTQVPILIMNGTLDPRTPLAGAERARAALGGERVHFVTIPNAGHTVVAQSPVRTPDAAPCGMQILVRFLGGGALDTTCLDDLEPPKLDRGAPSNTMVWGTASAWDDF